MSTINPVLPNPELVKIEVDQFQSMSIEREKIMKIEMEMVNLVREREWLKKEVDLLEKTQSYTELVKCSLEEKLIRSERRCEELDEKIKKFEDLRRKEIETSETVDELRLKEKLIRSERRCEELDEKIKKFEDLRRKEIETSEAVDELRLKKMESEKAAQLYKSRIDDLEPRVLKVEATLAKVLNVNLANLDKFAAAATHAENGNVKADARDADGNGGIGLSKKGGRNLVYSGTEEDVTNVLSGSKRDSKAAGSKGPLQDNEGKNEVRGASYRMKLECRCTLKTINVIKDNLQEENLKIFEQSCFGDLLKINEFKFQGHLILQLLLHMDMSASNKERLIFKINNSKMEFKSSDFFRITGLHFGKLDKTITTSSSSIHKDVFQGRPTITMRNIEEAFLNISSCHKGKGELALKLALLYFLYGTLLNTNRTKKIDVQYLYLIEDLKKFNAFPWGRVSYELLVSSVLQVRHRMDSSEVIHQVARLDIYGFCYALQAWAYEVMPSVAAYCAIRMNNFENLTPWILRWSATITLYSDNLKKFFPLGDKGHLQNNTMGKSEELSINTIPHVATPLNRVKQNKRKLLCDNGQMPHAQPSSAATSTTPPPPSMNMSTYSSHHLARRLSRAESMLESLLRKVDQPNLDISYDDLPRNEFPRVDDEEDVSSATLTRHSTSRSNPVSMNKATDKHARALSELANDNPTLDSARVRTQTNAHVVQSETMQTQPLVGRCPSSAAGNVTIISDNDDDDDEVGAASDLQSNDSDDELLSDRYMNNLVAELKREASRK